MAKKIVDGEYEQVNEQHYSPMLIQTVKACMTADPAKRPNVIDLCQLMIPAVMDQLDQLRQSGFSSVKEIKVLKDRLKVFEGTSNAFAGTMGGFKSANRSDNQTPAADSDNMKLVQVNSDQLKKLS